MQCTMPIHPYTWLHVRYHVVDQRVLYLVWPYFNTSREKRTTYPILMALYHNLYHQLRLQLLTQKFALLQSETTKREANIQSTLLNMIGKRAPEHLYTMCIRGVVQTRSLDRKFLPQTNKSFDVHENFGPPPQNPLYSI